ncbi:hypothetical protein A2936_02105 [Candidatus Uhrbacteria bacterium RIFCSPLOWO2_01_FULL_47_25]|uniref:AbiEi antitoxin C-terminal domain-containing protein n=2 Tax=Patescibacteria group TaxID=1783273 RepID=A0A1F7UU94_9BACT|nr:MAG: hypothetical protein A2693_03870 [Candidatus Curtissbacteria bacterium RIFCSPHIGHO2_01_FULL_40_12]OGL81294.1 MAG: hypothetical protein A2936_02105 [Candidatus Uhrbacteria bacterium RIFCSPLOWO2_01_FULL_47_25]
MTSISALAIQQKIKALNLRFITPPLLASLLNRTNRNTVYKTLQRLEKYQVLTRLKKGQYLVTGADVPEFVIANFIVKPSYISLESALAHYGVIAQFTYTITSATTQRAQKIIYEKREFEYSKINPRFFWGYEKQKSVMIARPEKACLDYLYLAAKGLRNSDINEWDLTSLNKNQFKSYAAKINFAPLQKLLINKKLL